MVETAVSLLVSDEQLIGLRGGGRPYGQLRARPLLLQPPPHTLPLTARSSFNMYYIFNMLD